MSEFVISTRYANALMSIADENDSFENVLHDIYLVNNTLEASKELRNVLSNPIIKSNKKDEILVELFNNLIGDDVRNFLKFIVEKGRESLLIDFCKRFIALSNEKLNQIDVIISSAIELNEIQKEEIKTKLETIVNKKVTSSFAIDKSIIGGFKARFGDTVVDASIQHQLHVLKKKLFEENYLKN